MSRPWLLCGSYVVLHLLTHVSAGWFEVQPGVPVSIWYPPAGLALALLVLLGPRYAPVVFAANLAGALLRPDVAWPTFFFPAMITGVYAGTAWAVRRAVGPRLLPGDWRSTLVFCAAVVGAPLAAALIALGAVHWGGLAPAPLTREAFLRSVFEWWVGDASGVLTVVPVVMVFVGPWLEGRRVLPRADALEPRQVALGAVRWGLLVGMVLLVLAVPGLREHSAFYLCFLPLVWICVHHGVRGTALATLVVMLVGLVGMRWLGTTAESSYIFLLFEMAVVGVGLGLGTMVSRRRAAEGQLAASQAQLDRAIAGAQLGLWDWDLTEDRPDSNRRLAKMLGDAGRATGAPTEGVTALLHPDDRGRVEAALADHLEGRTPLYECDYRLRAHDGRWRWIRSRGSVVARDRRGRPARVSGTHLDITDRKHAESEVGRLLSILEATPDFVLTTDRAGRILFANAALLAACETQLPAVVGREMALLFPGEGGWRLRDEALPAALAAGAWRGEVQLRTAAGRTIPTSQVVLAQPDDARDGAVVSYVMRDISDQRQAEAERIEHQREMLQLQKAESLAVLAGGMAHDFNNLLTAVVCNTNLAREELPAGTLAQTFLGNVEEAAGRAAALCHQMLAYAGRAPVAFAEVDLSRLVQETMQLFAPGLSRKITVEFDLERPIALVVGSTTQLQQVVMNLALNAADAIGDGEGRLTFRTRGGRFSAEDLAVPFAGAKLPAGAYVLLEVTDTGCGMSADVQRRIFEPFFTTKFTGQGLGLAAVSGIVKTHHGVIEVHSMPGEGTSFRIALPAVAAGGAAAPVEPLADEVWRSGGTVLVVDDDPRVRQVATLLLQRLGFEVVVAANGADGVAAYRATAGRLRCVLLDLTMAPMDGFETHAEMHRLEPKVPVILMSGYSQRLAALPPEVLDPAAVMAKPFGLEQLRTRLRTVLATREPAPAA